MNFGNLFFHSQQDERPKSEDSDTDLIIDDSELTMGDAAPSTGDINSIGTGSNKSQLEVSQCFILFVLHRILSH